MSLSVDIDEPKVGTRRVTLGGTLDTETAPLLQKHLDGIVDSGVRQIVLDLANLEYISSAGLGVLFWTKKAMDAKQGSLLMVNLQPQVKKVFEIVKAIPTMAVFRDYQELDDYLDYMQKHAGSGLNS